MPPNFASSRLLAKKSDLELALIWLAFGVQIIKKPQPFVGRGLLFITALLVILSSPCRFSDH